MIKRGSEWHRWDFHVHTPYSILNNGFCDDPSFSDNEKDNSNFDKYVVELFKRALENNIEAVGITDYFCIEGYKKIKQNYLDNKEWIKSSELKQQFTEEDIKKISDIYFFPNVELRTDNFITSNRKNNAINIHLIFSDDISIDDIENNILTELKIGEEKLGLNIQNIERVGQNLKKEKDENGLDLLVGFKNITVNFEDILELVRKPMYENKIILAIPVDEDLSKVDWDGRDYETKKKYYKNANCYFTSNRGTINNFALNKKAMKDFDGCKPCIWGSDAHNYEKMFRPDENRYCWINSELSFEGLRQILFEPAERVKIQEINPNSHKKSYNIIDSIEFKSENRVFQKEPIYLNENLNCIIGGKSTGKSLLLYNIAKKFINESDIFYNDSIYEDLHNKYRNFNDDVMVKWKNDGQNKKLIYIPQSYFEKIFYNEKGNNNEIVNRVVEDYLCKKFSNIKSFKENYEKEITENEIKLVSLIDEIGKLEENIITYNEHIKNKGDIEVHEKEIEEIKIRMSSAQHLDISEKDIEEYNKLQESIVNLNDSIERMDRKISFINAVDPPIVSFKEIDNYNILADYYVNDDFDDIRKLKETYQNEIKDKWEKDKKELISRWKSDIDKSKEELIEKQNMFNAINSKIKANSEFEILSKKLEDEQRLKNEVEGYIKIIKANEDELKKKKCDMEIMYKEYFKIFDEYKERLLANVINNNKSNEMQFALEKEIITIGVENVNKWVNNKSTKNNILEKYTGSIKLDNNEDFVKDLFDGEIVLKSGIDKYDILKECYKRPFTLRYDVKLDDCSLYNSSEGKKAKILLDLIIKLSDEVCPILIDQPEDDLDNRSIYEDLVAYIKDIKKNRQMIIVTHNANVVIGADSEEIIIANQNGEKTENENAQFEYRVGSIEDITVEDENSKSILKNKAFRKQVCQILEGGKDAFKLRENKYNI